MAVQVAEYEKVKAELHDAWRIIHGHPQVCFG